MNTAEDLVRGELAAWEAYWDPTANSQDQALYVPGMILDMRATLSALAAGVDFGEPGAGGRVDITRYWRSEMGCRRAFESTISPGAFAAQVAALDAADWEEQGLTLIRWRPADHSTHMVEVPPLGGLDQVSSGPRHRRLWMPWVPGARAVAAPEPFGQLELFGALA